MKAAFIRTSTFALALTLIAGFAMAQQHDGLLEVDPLVFASGTVGGAWNPLATAITEKAHDYMVGRPISVRPGAGGAGNPVLVARGNADFGISLGAFLVLASEGNDPFDAAHPNLRAVMALVPQEIVMVADSRIEAEVFEDILTQRLPINMATSTPGSSELLLFRVILGLHGLTLSDVSAWGGRIETIGGTDRLNAWKDRRTDVSNVMIIRPAGLINEMLLSRSGRILPLAQETRDVLVREWGLIETIIDAGTYPGQDEDIYTVGAPIVVFTHTGVPDDVVYTLVKAAAENTEYLGSAIQSMRSWVPSEMHVGLGIEIHPGAERYYRERGWID